MPARKAPWEYGVTMGKAFDKIAAGLEEVLVIARGEATPARANLLYEAETISRAGRTYCGASCEACLKGTRLPVRIVGAIAAVRGVKEARATYPQLSRWQVEFAVVYAKAHPRKGRLVQLGEHSQRMMVALGTLAQTVAQLRAEVGELRKITMPICVETLRQAGKIPPRTCPRGGPGPCQDERYAVSWPDPVADRSPPHGWRVSR
jgi:uncharacterized protein (DUF433 family)